MKETESRELFASVQFEGLENLRKISADRCLRVEAICTGRTRVKVKILET